MTIYDLKPIFQGLLQPATRGLSRLGISANQVTLGALFASLAYGAWMLSAGGGWPFLLLPAFMLLRMALNAMDGMLARQYHQQSKLGALLNELGDVVSDAALFVPFAVLPGASPWHVMAVILLSTLTEFCGVLGQVVGAGRRYDGPFGKSDRAFAFGALGLAIGAGAPILPYLNPILLCMTGLLAWTVVNRIRRTLRQS